MRIALASCDPLPVPDTDAELLIPAIADRGGEAEAPVWTDADVDWGAFDLVQISSTWDYHERPDEFREWLRSTGAATRLENPAELVEWNLDKRYLRELEHRGIPVVPTIWFESYEGRYGAKRRDAGNEAEAEAVARGWSRAVVKPAVDLGAMRLKRVPATGIASALADLGEPALVQPFLGSVEEEGELSIIFFGGEVAHTIRKRPAAGDFRVQEHYGARHTPVDPPQEGLELARSVLATLDKPPLYGRVDMVRDPDGVLCVIELELIEPNLYLDKADATVVGWLADLFVERAGRPSRRSRRPRLPS